MRFTVTVLLLLIISVGFCQESSIERYTKEDGLPSDLVKALAMDSNGFIWVATDGGLAKIEGRNIINVNDQKMPANSYKDILLSKKYGFVGASDNALLKISQDFSGISSHGLVDDLTLHDYPEVIFPKSIYESRDSSLWFSDIKDIIRIRGTEVTTFDFPEKNHTTNFFRSYQLMELDTHRLFVLSQKGYLYDFDNAKDTMVEIPWKYAGTEIYAVHKLNSNQFLIGCSKGLLKITFDKGLIHDVIDLQFEQGAYVIEPFTENRLLVGTLGSGAYQIVLNDNTITYTVLPGSEGQAVLDIVVDKQQQIWLGTGYGLFLYRHMAFENLFDESSLADIFDLKPGQNSQLFFTDGIKVYQTNSDNELSKYYTLNQGAITSIFPYINSVWIGTRSGEIIEQQNDETVATYDFSKEGNEIISLVVDKSSAVWFIQTRNGKPTLLRMKTGGIIEDFTPVTQEEFELRFLELSPDGAVYVGAMGINNYLFTYNTEKNAIDNISLPTEYLNESLLLHDIAFAEDGTRFLATEKGILKHSENSIEIVDLGNISYDAITGIALDKMGRIWFGHSTGIICHNNGELLVYDNSDGLNNKTTSFRCLYIDSENRFWAGSQSGINYTKVPNVFMPSLAPIIVRIENMGSSIAINGENKFLQNSLLKVGFASSGYPAQFVKYQYSLNKKDGEDNWIYIDYKDDYLVFEYLNKGIYSLKIRAKSKGHYSWSKPTTYQFKISKNWYSRPEYIIGINLIFLLLGYLYLKYSKVKNARKRKELEALIAERTKELLEQNERLVKTQNQLIQSEKMASVGILAAGVAHEINNPINYISGGIAVLKKTIQKLETHLNSFSLASANYDAKTKETFNLPDENAITNLTKVTNNMFGSIEDGIKKTTDIVQSIRIFSSNSENVFAPMDVNEALDSVLLMLYNKYKGRIDIVKEYDVNATIMAVPANIQQVFMNLLVNAIQAIPLKGIIWIKTKRKQSSFIISIKDTGKGIPIVIQKKIFDPFFSTKDVGTGTGLGLYLSYTFVQQHHGTIQVFSESGKGAEFVVELPLTQQQANG